MSQTPRINGLMSEALEMMCRRVIQPNAEQWLEAVIALLRNENPEDAVTVRPNDNRDKLVRARQQTFSLTFGEFPDFYSMLDACAEKDGLTLSALLKSQDDIILPPSPVEVGMRMLRLADVNHVVPPDYASIIRAVETEGHRRCPREALYHIGRNPPELHVGERAYILCDPIVNPHSRAQVVPYITRRERDRWSVEVIDMGNHQLLRPDIDVIVID